MVTQSAEMALHCCPPVCHAEQWPDDSMLPQGLLDTRKWIGLSAAATGSWAAAVAVTAACQVKKTQSLWTLGQQVALSGSSAMGVMMTSPVLTMLAWHMCVQCCWA